ALVCGSVITTEGSTRAARRSGREFLTDCRDERERARACPPGFSYRSMQEVTSMPGFLPFTVRQPQPFDLVDDPVGVCGVGTGFEGVFEARIRDGNNNELVQMTINAGGTGTWANFHLDMSLGGPPPT